MLNSCKFKSASLALTILLLGAVQAAAHPHVYISNRSDVVFSDTGKITGLIIEWIFDENYSADATEGLDADGDGSFSAGELEVLAQENLKALKDYSYFVYSKLDEDKVAYADVTEFGQIHSQGKLKMYFTIPLQTPIDPKKGKFSYTIYDPSFFIAIDYPDASAVSFVGKKPANCVVEMKQLTADTETL